MAVVPSSSSDGSNTAEIIILYSKGIICGETCGTISVYEKVDEKEVKEGLKKVSSFKVDKNGAKVCGLALSSNEEVLVCILDNNHLLNIPFQHRDLFKLDEVPKEIVCQVCLK